MLLWYIWQKIGMYSSIVIKELSFYFMRFKIFNFEQIKMNIL